MKTIVTKMEETNLDNDVLDKAGEILRNGGLVAFPTETVYGLGGNALDEEAARRIYEAKGRPSDNPLIVHIAKFKDLVALVEDISENAKILMANFWPGPLTIIFKKSKLVPDAITGGLDTVAIRMPSHPLALALIEKANIPVAAPSANTSGKPSPTIAKHVVEDLDGRVDMIIDGGDTGFGVESTVVDVSGEEPMILRPGGITAEDLKELFGSVNIDPALDYGKSDLAPKSPGQKYKHYSPKAEVVIFESDSLEKLAAGIKEKYDAYVDDGYNVGIMATEETEEYYEGYCSLLVGNRAEPISIAANLFKKLREFDELNVDFILAEGLDELGINLAIMNRLKKAAGGKLIFID